MFDGIEDVVDIEEVGVSKDRGWHDVRDITRPRRSFFFLYSCHALFISEQLIDLDDRPTA